MTQEKAVPVVGLDSVIGHSKFHGGPRQQATLRQWLEADNRTAQHRARQLALGLIEQQAATIAELRAKVERAAKIFRGYAELHRAKGTEEGDAKAASNEVIAEEMEAVLAKVRP